MNGPVLIFCTQCHNLFICRKKLFNIFTAVTLVYFINIKKINNYILLGMRKIKIMNSQFKILGRTFTAV